MNTPDNSLDFIRTIVEEDVRKARRQDAPVDWLENGSIYVFKPWVLRNEHSRLGGKIAVFEMPILDSFQVDEPDDLRLIEQLSGLSSAPETSSRSERPNVG